MEITDITRESDDAVQEMVVTMTASADEVNTYIEQQFKELAKNEIPVSYTHLTLPTILRV